MTKVEIQKDLEAVAVILNEMALKPPSDKFRYKLNQQASKLRVLKYALDSTHPDEQEVNDA